ncbi:DUF5990 family protein [Antrihabitans stalactiti]|uniref:Monooxygenase n=1 Tax=Antrihabitans stalactiti TaxID=2584121 RepID=A0A848KPT6_9NOCA|nr:DUF5990 family protein [Antrihabitans stalactiti]NMN98612.1 hypothetical protein [Antrihabitans stalactiti]
MRIRIVGTELPGCKHDEYSNVHLGLQVRNEVVDRVRADVERAVFELDVNLVETPDGIDFRGPSVHGRRGERFLYLSWGNVEADGTWQMFRRAKLQLGAIDAELFSAPVVVGALALTDECGAPRCASVRPPRIEWSREG